MLDHFYVRFVQCDLGHRIVLQIIELKHTLNGIMSNQSNALDIDSSCSSCSSSDDVESDYTDDEIDKSVNSRKKREIQWCATNTDLHTASASKSRIVVWPPESNATAFRPQYVPWPKSAQKYWGNPNYDTKMQLYSKTGYLLAINADGTINGTRDKNDLHTKLQLINVGEAGHVRILGLLTGQYLALGDRGRPYAHYNMYDPNTEWLEVPVGNYKCYRNVLSFLRRKKRGNGWFLGLKKNGTAKNGKRTKAAQNATKFLSIRPPERH